VLEAVAVVIPLEDLNDLVFALVCVFSTTFTTPNTNDCCTTHHHHHHDTNDINNTSCTRSMTMTMTMTMTMMDIDTHVLGCVIAMFGRYFIPHRTISHRRVVSLLGPLCL
jgi:hypothetical protein